MKRKDAGRNKKAESVRKIGENSKREEILQKAGAYSAVFFMAFFVALVSASAFTPVDRSEAATTEVNLSAGDYSLTVVSANTAQMNLTATSGGELAVAKDTITITTNSLGYKVYLSMNGSDTNLWKDGSSSSGYNIATSTASVDAPAALTGNAWGWALADPDSATSTTIQNYNFDTIYCMTSGSCSDGYTGSLNTSNKFAGMPAAGSPALVAYSTTKAQSGDTQDIYYGVSATTAKVSGTYSGTVVYTAVAEATNAAEGAMSFDQDYQTQVDTGELRTISTSLYASKALINDISNVSVTIGGESCTNPVLVKTDGTPWSEDTTSTGGQVNVTCTTPIMRWGSYDVAVTIGDYESFNQRAGYSYYIPYNTIKNAQPGTYKMQEFTTKTCSEMPRPATNNGKGYASNGKVIGDYADKTVPSWYGKDGNATTTNPVPQIILKDSRDNRLYQVRRLADGNCWMAQNLELTFYTGTDGTGYNTDTTATVSGSTVKTGSVANGKTELTSDDTDLHSKDRLSLANPGFNLYATQSVAGPRWSDTGETGDGTESDGTGGNGQGGTGEGRSFSWATQNSSHAYAKDTGTVNEYGQKLWGDAATPTTPDGEETRRANLYNWTVATLGSGANLEVDNTEAEDSICPANWQLPTNSTDKTNRLGYNYSIRNLVQTYFNGAYTTGNPQDTSDQAKSLRLVTEQNIMRSEPISMVVSGIYYRSSGTLVGRTTYGGYVWFSTAGSATYARYLNTFPTNFAPQYSTYRGYGFPVRCVSR